MILNINTNTKYKLPNPKSNKLLKNPFVQLIKQ